MLPDANSTRIRLINTVKNIVILVFSIITIVPANKVPRGGANLDTTVVLNISVIFIYSLIAHLFKKFSFKQKWLFLSY